MKTDKLIKYIEESIISVLKLTIYALLTAAIVVIGHYQVTNKKKPDLIDTSSEITKGATRFSIKHFISY